MNRHLETIGLAVAYADLDLLPLAIVTAYEEGATPAEVRAAVEGGCFLGDVSARVRAWALRLAQAWPWLMPRHEAPYRRAA
jgi:alkylhydroperoxidase/carboxymuconolactone decarboxylase family protein YurZ